MTEERMKGGLLSSGPGKETAESLYCGCEACEEDGRYNCNTDRGKVTPP